MAAKGKLHCAYCGKTGFASARGLSQHQQQTKLCRLQSMSIFNQESGYFTAHQTLQIHPQIASMPPRLRDMYYSYRHELITEDALARNQIATNQSNDRPKKLARSMPEQTDDQFFTANENAFDGQDSGYLMLESDEEEEDNNAFFGHNPDNLQDEIACDSTLRVNYNDFARMRRNSDNEFAPNYRNAIELLLTLRHTRASLDTYESVMLWHFRATNKGKSNQKLSGIKDFLSRKRLFRLLGHRYNITEKCAPQVECVTLPSTKAKANIVKYDAKTLMISLLTDPRIRDEDYLFFNDNPLSSPPNDLDYVEDLNTGLAYTESYRDLITKPGREVLLPVIFYIDAANTGQFSDLPITAVKFTLGIFNRKARDKEHLWRTLGYLPEYHITASKGRRIVAKSGHLDSLNEYTPDLVDGNQGNTVPKAQDLHYMLDKILASYRQMEESGFVWDLHYKGQLYMDIEFVLFTPFLKLDSDEADKLCGKYTVRTSNVAQLCRYCKCPTEETDNPTVTHPLKTMPEISTMVTTQNVEGLKQLSQQNIHNCWYKIQFGTHTAQGVHGACPMEMLHAILLGVFKYVRDCIFEQLGPTSKMGEDFDARSTEFGIIMSRQSQRDLPKTRFGKGINKGKLMAKEYPGILLCMAATLRSTGGRQRIMGKEVFKNNNQSGLKDWLMLIETLLQWEMWLKADRMRLKHVLRAKKKHRYIMYLMKKVCNRSTGMGLKIVKYHAIMHMARDILNFGVPMCFDTGSNESGHKATKKAAKLTQKCGATFDQQTAKRLDEIRLLELAEQEFEGRVIWDYGTKHRISPKPAPETPPDESSRLVGGRIVVKWEEDMQDYLAIIHHKTNDPGRLETGFIHFMGKLQEEVFDELGEVQFRSELVRHGVRFRANHCYRTRVWRDWVAIDWGEEEGQLPAKLWGFVDFTQLSPDFCVPFQQSEVTRGMFAIVESAVYSIEPETMQSELFRRIVKEVGGPNEGQYRFYLVDIESFVRPIVVIPDIGGKPNEYFELRDRDKWKEDFEAWLELPHRYDEIDMEIATMPTGTQCRASSEDEAGLEEDQEVSSLESSDGSDDGSSVE